METDINKMADQVTWHFSNGYIFFHIQHRDFWFEALDSVACLDYDGCYGNYGFWNTGFWLAETVLAITSLKIKIETRGLKHKKGNQA